MSTPADKILRALNGRKGFDDWFGNIDEDIQEEIREALNGAVQPSTEIIKAAEHMDWMQVVLNQGPPCFHLEDGRFCGRAERWDGHKAWEGSPAIHAFISLADLLKKASAT